MRELCSQICSVVRRVCRWLVPSSRRFDDDGPAPSDEVLAADARQEIQDATSEIERASARLQRTVSVLKRRDDALGRLAERMQRGHE